MISLPCRAQVEMLYPERREIAADTDRIVFTPSATGMSTTLFRCRYTNRKGIPVGGQKSYREQSAGTGD